jgi:hypothetical protein
LNNLLAAIMTKCAGSALSSDVGGRIFFDEAPDGSEFPYVVFRITSSSPQDTFSDSIEDTSIEFSLYSISESAAEITAIYADLMALFDWQAITITGGTCIWVVRQGLVTMFDDITTPEGTVGARHWAVDYSIMVQGL